MTRIERVVVGALLGAVVGAVAGVVFYRYGAEKVCSIIPRIFDKAVENSADQIRAKLANSTMVHATIFKDKIINNADVLHSLFNNSKVDTVLSGIKYLAGKIPAVAEKAPAMADFSAKLLVATNPLLAGFSSAVFDVSKEVLKTALVGTCVTLVNQYKIIPITLTVTGLLIGTIAGVYSATAAKQAVPAKID